MNIDIETLKATALACDPSKCADEVEHERRLSEFYSECEPEDVLGLIAENERLRSVLAPVAASTAQTRQRWLDNITKATHVGLPKWLRRDLARTYDEIQSSMKHGGRRRLLEEIEALRPDAERYRYLREIATSQDIRYPLMGKPDEIDATVDAARAAATSAQEKHPESEVFAWLYTKESNGAIMIYRMKQHYPGNWVENDGYCITPLYTGPVNGEPTGWAYRVRLGKSLATWRVSLTEPAYSGDPGDIEVIGLYKRESVAAGVPT